MSITYKVGDLLDAPEPILIHGCNAKGVMGSGVAKAIRSRHPSVYQDYRDAYDRNGLKLGEVVWSWVTTPMEEGEPRIVGNAITQASYGRDGQRYVNYQAVADAMFIIEQFIKANASLFSYEPYIAMPRIGAGLGGGDWEFISSIIEGALSDYEVVVYDLP